MKGEIKMMVPIQPRVVRLDDFTAESLEAMAKSMPPGDKEHADALLKIANRFRASSNTRMIRVWEEQSEQKKPTVSKYSVSARDVVREAERRNR